MPLRLTVAFGHDVALLSIVRLPETAPALLGVKVMGRAMDCPEFSVKGRDGTEIVNPAPATLAEDIVSGPVPNDVSVRDFVTGVLTPVEPNATASEETLSAGVAA